jgi:hypothetical protein
LGWRVGKIWGGERGRGREDVGKRGRGRGGGGGDMGRPGGKLERDKVTWEWKRVEEERESGRDKSRRGEWNEKGEKGRG